MKNYYNVLPKNYKEKYVIDGKRKRTAILFTVGTVVLSLLVILLLVYIKTLSNENYLKYVFNDKYNFLYLIGFAVAYILYIVLHELTHGIFYKIFTKQKLTFGLNLTMAWCGLKDGYFNKKTGLFAILAPLVLFTILLLPLCLILNGALSFYLILLFSFHFAGCIGDMYGTIIMLTMPKDVLINDNGYKQTFYVPDEEN